MKDLRAALAAAPSDERPTIQEKLNAAQHLAQQQGLQLEPDSAGDDVEEIMYVPYFITQALQLRASTLC